MQMRRRLVNRNPKNRAIISAIPKNCEKASAQTRIIAFMIGPSIGMLRIRPSTAAVDRAGGIRRVCAGQGGDRGIVQSL